MVFLILQYFDYHVVFNSALFASHNKNNNNNDFIQYFHWKVALHL